MDERESVAIKDFVPCSQSSIDCRSLRGMIMHKSIALALLFPLYANCSNDVQHIYEQPPTPRNQHTVSQTPKLAKITNNIKGLETSLDKMTVYNVSDYRHRLECIYAECRSLHSATPGMQERLDVLETAITKVEYTKQDSGCCIIS